MSSITKIKVADTTYDIKDNVSGYITKDVDDLTNYYDKEQVDFNIEQVSDEIPTRTSQLTNDSGFVGTAALAGKQDTLVSGTNIKTINGANILGSGNLVVESQGEINLVDDVQLNGTSIVADKVANIHVVDNYGDNNPLTTQQNLQDVHDELDAKLPYTMLDFNDTTNHIKTVEGTDLPVAYTRMDGNSYQETTTGKNIVPNNGTTATINGVTFTKQQDGTVIANGTATTRAIFSIGAFPKLTGTYTISGCPEGGSSWTYCIEAAIYAQGGGEIAWPKDTGSGIRYNFDDNAGRMYIVITAGTTVNNLVFKPQLESGSVKTSYEPYTGGQPSPSPDYPQEVKTLKGYNLVNIYGDYIKREESAYSNITRENETLSYTITNIYSGYLGFVIPTEIGQSYTLSYGDLIGDIMLVELDNIITEVGTNYGTKRLSGYTFTATKPYLGVWLEANPNAITNPSVSNLMLNEGTQPKLYLPYNNIGLKFTGKNYINPNDIAYGPNNVKPFFTSGFLIKSGETWTMSYKGTQNCTGLYIRKKSDGSSLKTAYNAKYQTYTAVEDELIYIDYYLNNIEQDINNFQFEKGSTATPYEPYQSQTKTIDLQDNFIGKLPNGVKDELSIDKQGNVILNKKIGKVVLKGSGSYTNLSLHGGTTYMTINKSDTTVKIVPNTAIACISDIFMGSSLDKVWSGAQLYGIALGSNGKYFQFSLPQTVATTVEEFKTFLSTHNATVYYELETPYTVDLGNIGPIDMFVGTNNILVSTNIDTNYNMRIYNKSGLIPTLTSQLINDSGFVTQTGLGDYALASEAAHTMTMEVNTDYVLTSRLKNKNGSIINTTTVDLPIEGLVMNGRYDTATKKIILTLKNGNTIEFSIADLISDRQPLIDSTHKLNSDLINTTGQTNQFVLASDKTNWNGKQDGLVSGVNIKTINNISLLGSGNINISGGGGGGGSTTHHNELDNLDYENSGHTGFQPAGNYALATNVLGLDNTQSYTPTSTYHPATKKYVDDKPTILYGTSTPTSSQGKNGDIYLKYTA